MKRTLLAVLAVVLMATAAHSQSLTGVVPNKGILTTDATDIAVINVALTNGSTAALLCPITSTESGYYPQTIWTCDGGQAIIDGQPLNGTLSGTMSVYYVGGGRGIPITRTYVFHGNIGAGVSVYVSAKGPNNKPATVTAFMLVAIPPQYSASVRLGGPVGQTRLDLQCDLDIEPIGPLWFFGKACYWNHELYSFQPYFEVF